MRTALITGISGQDGAYLSKMLLEKGYQVIGLLDPSRNSSLWKLDHLGIRNCIRFERCDLKSPEGVRAMLDANDPDEIYNFAAQSSVGASFRHPSDTIHFNILSVLNILDALRSSSSDARFYQSSSSEMYGKVDKLPVREDTPMHPLSPYAVSKAAAHWMTINYRESYGLFACCGICFNHESFLRDERFFVKKVITEALRIKAGEQEVLKVGNLDVSRDFGFGPKYVEAMWMMLQNGHPGDYLICSGRSISLRSIVEHVFERLNIDMDRVWSDPSLTRPNEMIDIFGDNSKARMELGWTYDMDFFEVLDRLMDEETEVHNRLGL